MQVWRLASWQAEGHAPHQVVRPLPARPWRGHPAGLVCTGLTQPVQGSLGHLAEEWCAGPCTAKLGPSTTPVPCCRPPNCTFQEQSSSHKDRVAAAMTAMLQGRSSWCAAMSWGCCSRRRWRLGIEHTDTAASAASHSSPSNSPLVGLPPEIKPLCHVPFWLLHVHLQICRSTECAACL